MALGMVATGMLVAVAVAVMTVVRRCCATLSAWASYRQDLEQKRPVPVEQSPARAHRGENLRETALKRNCSQEKLFSRKTEGTHHKTHLQIPTGSARQQPTREVLACEWWGGERFLRSGGEMQQ